MKYFIYFYAIVALYIAIGVGWRMVSRLDQYDCEGCRKSVMWIIYFAVVLLWPMLIVRSFYLLKQSRAQEKRDDDAT